MSRRPMFPFDKLNNYSALVSDQNDPFLQLGESDESDSDAGSSTDSENDSNPGSCPAEGSVLFENDGWGKSSSTTSIGADVNFLKCAESFTVLNLSNGFTIKYPQAAFSCSVDGNYVKFTPKNVGTHWTVELEHNSLYIYGEAENRIFVEPVDDVSLAENLKVEIEESVITLEFVEMRAQTNTL